MSETISKASVCEILADIYPTDGEKVVAVKEVDKAYEAIQQLPSAQPEIIYCRECKWKQGSECVMFADVRPFPNDFCSRAERRQDE